ncbi:DeoR/GlpR family DNA-binding transcription regulator [Roseobacter sp.]|uniref:DeoR/GlpR family DNA-binding transcription regulator n=1 Tax=Roseobacter sp. TaxID=1907202 RepID=UPI003297275C
MNDLNNPDTRQAALRARLTHDAPLVASALAQEWGISVHTIRRDLIALEREGLVRRIRGGAMPVTGPAPSYHIRAHSPDAALIPLAISAAGLVPPEGTVFIDAGTTMTAVAARLPASFRGLIVTPAPSVALAALAQGAQVHMLGGALCPEGAMATGGDTERAIGTIAADLCVLGACGLWPDFGLSAEDAGEAGVKRAMARAASQVTVVASAAKLKRRGRHRVIPPADITTIVTDASPNAMASFADAGIEIVHV